MKLSLTARLITVALALATPAFAQSTAQTTTITGKMLDLATYMTHDHNMDSMKGDSMKGDSMKGDSMKGDVMKDDSMKGDSMKADAMHGGKACPSMLGVVSQGKAYPLTFQMGSAMAATACAHVGMTATRTGSLYESNGLTILLVRSVHSRRGGSNRYARNSVA